MMIKEKQLCFNHLIKIKRLDENILDIEDGMQGLLANYGVYINGPIIIQSLPSNEELEVKINYFIPINQKLNIQSTEEMEYVAELRKKCLYFRVLDSKPEAIQQQMSELFEYADKEGYEILDPPYQCLINVYGEIIVDVYLPVQQVELF